MKILMTKIKVNPKNARKHFTGIDTLAADIERNGLSQKILVRPIGDYFEVVCGDRRLRALQLLRRDKIDCEISKHYCLTGDELDFIINYDIKYRMGGEL